VGSNTRASTCHGTTVTWKRKTGARLSSGTRSLLLVSLLLARLVLARLRTRGRPPLAAGATTGFTGVAVVGRPGVLPSLLLRSVQAITGHPRRCLVSVIAERVPQLAQRRSGRILLRPLGTGLLRLVAATSARPVAL